MAAITERRRRGDHGQRNGANCGQERKKILLLSAEDLAGGRDGEEKSGTDESEQPRLPDECLRDSDS